MQMTALQSQASSRGIEIHDLEDALTVCCRSALQCSEIAWKIAFDSEHKSWPVTRVEARSLKTVYEQKLTFRLYTQRLAGAHYVNLWHSLNRSQHAPLRYC